MEMSYVWRHEIPPRLGSIPLRPCAVSYVEYDDNERQPFTFISGGKKHNNLYTMFIFSTQCSSLGDWWSI